MSLKERIISILFPVSCVICGKWGKNLCIKCFSKLPKVEYQKCPECGRHSVYGLRHPICKSNKSLSGCISIFLYKDSIKKIIKKIKYSGEYEIIKTLFNYLSSETIKESLRYFAVCKNNSIFISVPLYHSRLVQRGFNQAEIVADNISKMLSIQTKPKILIRIKNTETQAKIKRKIDREKNVRDAFYCDKIQNHIKNVVIIDDVWSSGATLRSCARAIKKTNPHVLVYAWTIAEGQ